MILFKASILDRIRATVFFRFGASARLRRRLKELKPTLVHAHFAPDAWLVAQTCEKLKLPLVVTLHGHDITSWPRQPGRAGRIARRHLRVVLSQATVIVAVSHFIRQEAIAWGADASKVRVVYTGTRVDSLPKRVDSPQFDVVFIGRLVAKKGVPDLLQALKIVKDSSSHTPRAVIVGDGPLREDMEALAAEHELDVSFVGVRTQSEIQGILADSKMLVNPSRLSPQGDAEGFGMVFLEAAAAELPSVAYIHGGVPEAVDDQSTGLLSPEGDVVDLARSIMQLLDNDQLRREMGARAKQRLLKEFLLDRGVAELEQIYADIREQKGPH
jgi:colanic acid/amylovoran biosynthesis glycosyltransferase